MGAAAATTQKSYVVFTFVDTLHPLQDDLQDPLSTVYQTFHSPAIPLDSAFHFALVRVHHTGLRIPFAR